MVYIVTEDSGAGFQFWEAVNNELLLGKAHVISTNGSKNMLYTIGITNEPKNDKANLDRIKLSPGDTLIVFLDEIGDRHSLFVRRYIDMYMQNFCTDVRYIRVCGVYSFEEFILSFTQLEHWIPNNDTLLLEALYDIRKGIGANSRYNYWEAESDWQSKFQAKYGNQSTREQLSKAVLFRFTQYIKSFTVRPKRPSELGICWQTDCENHIKSAGSMQCSKCGLVNKHMAASEKLLELNDNSVLNSGVTLRDIIDLISYGS